MPYIGLNFAKEYLIPNYIGESLAALVPSALSLTQGLGQNPGCYNSTDSETNETVLFPIDIVPRYSVSVYFLLMFALLCISTLSFTMLNFSRVAINERKNSKAKQEANSLSELKDEKKLSQDTIKNDSQMPLQINDDLFVNVSNDSKEKLLLYVFTFFLSFFCYGVLPGLQSYSTLPYGNLIANFHIIRKLKIFSLKKTNR